MDRGGVLLQQLREKLGAGWMGSICRSTGAQTAKFVGRENGEFAVTVIWHLKDGTEKVFTKEFTRTYVLGSSFKRPMLEWRIEKRACDYARAIIQDVLSQRGVL
jgi:hypothetical protein